MPVSYRKLGARTSMIGIVLAVAYLVAIGGMFTSGNIPPEEPYISTISIVSLISAPLFVFLWAILHHEMAPEGRVFTRTSFGLVVIFAALTSINRYVAMTVVRQSLDMGITEGLEWFMPYGWPSIMAAIEVLAWGFFLGLALLFLAPAFRTGRLERAIFWTLILSGALSLVAVLGQILNSIPLNLLGVVAWGPGLILLFALLASWFQSSKRPG